MDFVLKKELENSNRLYVEIITAKTTSELKNKIERGKGIVVVMGGNDDINRAALENKKTDILLSPEFNREKDFIHFRNSGLNQVLCKLANKKEIAIGFSFNILINSKNRELVLGKMMQNVDLCRKYKLKFVLGSFANKESEIKNKSELMSFGKIIGMNGKEIKESLNFKKKEAKIKILK